MAHLAEVEFEPRVAPSDSARLSAALQLDFECDALTGKTVLAGSVQQPPLRIIRAFSIDGGATLVHIHNVSGGLLGGDHLHLSARVGPRARAQLTTTGATRVYRPRPAALPSVQENEFRIAEDGLLEYVPDALIPYAGVRFRQRTSIQLGPGAGLFWWEIVAPGREARGEVFRYERLELKTDVEALGRPVAAENVKLEPQQRDVTSRALLGPYRYFATFYICRVGLSPTRWIKIEQQLRDLAGRLTRTGQVLWGVSLLAAEGLAVRCVAIHGCDVPQGLFAIWRAAKTALYECEPIQPRKVY